MRQHQFYKVELVSIVEPKDCMLELDRMLSRAEEILKKLEIPYQVVLLSSGDMGFSSEKTFDIEVWIPSEKIQGNFKLFIMWFISSKKNKAKYVLKMDPILGTLNGSGLAVGRLMIVKLENNQNKDGTITIPTILKIHE